VRVKDNQPRLHDALTTLCEAQPALDHLDTVDRHAHGREEHRRVEIFTVDDRLGGVRGEVQHPGALW
jgi:hypothetical protein